MAELQAELERRVQTLSERRTAVEKLDKRLVDLVDEQLQLGVPSSSENLQHLKVSLASRTEQQIQELEQRKQAYVTYYVSKSSNFHLIYLLQINTKFEKNKYRPKS